MIDLRTNGDKSSTVPVLRRDGTSPAKERDRLRRHSGRLSLGSPLSHAAHHHRQELEGLRLSNARLAAERNDAVESLRHMHEQQRRMYDDFKLLREKYDDLKAEMHRVLWEYIPSLGGKDGRGGAAGERFEFWELSRVNWAVFETPDRIQQYEMGDLLGEGQFANVRLCKELSSGRKLAIKVLPKKKVVSLTCLRRIQCEIGALRKIDHPNIVRLVDVINSPQHIYVVTEIGGKDLFEFFDRNPMGVDDATARQIVLGIALPLVHLHETGICHRDLKPENVLLGERHASGGRITHRDIRICDFGQCADISPGGVDERSLSELCGSPGFFAPEMILSREGRYSGAAADVWSLGCIAVELTRGHDDFCKTWMTSYDYNVLQDENVFEQSLCEAVEKIRVAAASTVDGSSDTVADFLTRILVLDPEKRIKSREMISHLWLRKATSDEHDAKVSFANRELHGKKFSQNLGGRNARSCMDQLHV